MQTPCSHLTERPMRPRARKAMSCLPGLRLDWGLRVTSSGLDPVWPLGLLLHFVLHHVSCEVVPGSPSTSHLVSRPHLPSHPTLEKALAPSHTSIPPALPMSCCSQDKPQDPCLACLEPADLLSPPSRPPIPLTCTPSPPWLLPSLRFAWDP